MIKPISYEDLPMQGPYANKLKEEVEEFLKSGAKLGEVDLGNRKPASVAASVKTYINRYNYPLRQFQKQNRVFVERTDK